MGVDVSKARECKASRTTAEILAPYGKETLKLGISFVPTIVFENVSNQPNQAYMIKYQT